MSEVKNPFTQKAAGSNRGGADNAKLAWVTAGLMAAFLIGALLMWSWAKSKTGRIEALRANLADANASLSNALGAVQSSKDQVAVAQKRLAELEQEKYAAGQAAKKLEEEMRSGLESKDVTISNLQVKLTVNILDRVVFDSGEAVLKPNGEGVLRKIAAILAEHSDLKVQVIGHTDNVPIHTRFPSNWELSTARALAAVHFLIERAGVAPTRVGAAGYGEYRPIADNSTAEGRAKNRRIAITILPDVLAGADVAPTAQTNAPLASPPGAASSTAPESTGK